MINYQYTQKKKELIRLTKKLYNSNPYIKEFNGNINKIIEKDHEYHVILNQTAFYPEGGGQPWDEGYIDDVRVTYVYESDGDIYHVLKKLPSNLEKVHCYIDWKRRFDHMQQHLGQHILSGAFEKLYDASTVGFHMSKEYTTIDIDKPLDKEDISKVEYFANQIVFNNLSVDILYPTENELKGLPLRKKPKVTENIRIVKIDDFDYSPCCGTHPNRTGEVGLIKVTKSENYKGGMRLGFLCGNRALKDYQWKNESINNISSILSVKDIETTEAVKKINLEMQNYKKQIVKLKNELIEYEAKDLFEKREIFHGLNIIKAIYKERDLKELKTLSSNLIENESTIVLLGVFDKDKAQLLFSCSKNIKVINMGNILKECIVLIDGKGGGNAFAAQGGGKSSENLIPAIELAENIIKKNIKK